MSPTGHRITFLCLFAVAAVVFLWGAAHFVRWSDATFHSGYVTGAFGFAFGLVILYIFWLSDRRAARAASPAATEDDHPPRPR